MGGVGRKHPVRSIVSLSPSTTEICGQVNITQDRVKGRTAADNYPTYFVSKIPIVATLKPDYEKIAAIQPDLILYDAQLYNESDVAKMKQLKAQLFEFKAQTIDGFIDELYHLGNLAGSETSISEYVDKIIAARATALGAASHFKTAVIMPGNGSEHMIAGADSFVADVVKAAGAEPVGPKADRFVPLNAELLISLNPDAIVTAGDPTAFINDPRFKSLKAVQNKKIVPIVSDIILRKGGRVDRLITALSEGLSKK